MTDTESGGLELGPRVLPSLRGAGDLLHEAIEAGSVADRPAEPGATIQGRQHERSEPTTPAATMGCYMSLLAGHGHPVAFFRCDHVIEILRGLA